MTPLRAPLLERDREIAALRAACRATREGHGSAWLLCAEAGGGKTRLAEEAVQACRGRVLWGATEPVTPPEPYLAVSRALPNFEPSAERRDSVARAIALVESEARGDPLAIVFDDLHFADEGTVAVVARLIAVCAGRPWLVIATFRPGEGPRSLLAPLFELAAQGATQRLDLAPLTSDGVAVLAGSVGGGRWNHADVDTLLRETGGNPWLVQALASGTGALTTLRDRISIRLDRLEQITPGSRRLLEALAPAAVPLPHSVVVQLIPDLVDLRGTLTVLRDAGVLQDREGNWAFQHELLRRALLDSMLTADRRDAHRALAEVLTATVTRGDRDERRQSAHVSAAALAMHYAEAGDERAREWALRAASEARAVDAHREAISQYERALDFAHASDQRREILHEIAVEARALGRFTDARQAAETALGLPGGEPELVARLHQVAAWACFLSGDLTADETHLAAAEQALIGRPVTSRTADIALARVSRAALAIEPARLAAAIERLLEIANRLDDAGRATWLRAMVARYRAVALIERGDPSGFDLLETMLMMPGAEGVVPETAANALLGAYEEAVVALFHDQSASLRPRLLETIHQRELRWTRLIAPYEALELVQRGTFAEARAYLNAMEAPSPGTIEQAVYLCALALLEARAGSLSRARAIVRAAGAGAGFQQQALLALARLEVRMAERAGELGELAQGVYGAMNRHRYARVAGVAAVALARSGRGVAPAPGWLAADAPLREFWDWAEAIHEHDVQKLRAAATMLTAMSCPYEAAMTLADAGNLRESYHMLRELGASHERARLAEEMRRSAQRIPRRRRDAADATGLTETERRICAIVARGASNDAIAAQLVVSVRTVETHLTNIYRKVGCRGRAALTAWWLARRDS